MIPCWNSKVQYFSSFHCQFIQGHWRGLIIRNGSVWPTLFLLNVFTALKGTHLYVFICGYSLETKEYPVDGISGQFFILFYFFLPFFAFLLLLVTECMMWKLYMTYVNSLQHLEIFTEIQAMPLKLQIAWNSTLQFQGHHSYFRKYFQNL